jgi:hypothetical protein
LELTAEDATVTYTGDITVPANSPIQLSALVAQADDGMPGDLALAQVRYDIKDATGVLVATITAPVTADGVSTAVLEEGLLSGAYTIEITVTGGFFSSPVISVELQISTNNQPVCSLAVASPDLLWPPNHMFVPISVIGVTDLDGDLLTITIDSIFQDEPVGKGVHSPDGKGIGTSIAEVRAERNAQKNGRVYHIFFTASDGQGGFCSGEVLVGVPVNMGNKKVPIDDGALYDSTIPD